MSRKSEDPQSPIFDALLTEDELRRQSPLLVHLLEIRHAAMAVLVRDSEHILRSAETPENLEAFQALVTEIDRLLDWTERDIKLLVTARERLVSVVESAEAKARRGLH